MVRWGDNDWEGFLLLNNHWENCNTNAKCFAEGIISTVVIDKKADVIQLFGIKLISSLFILKYTKTK